jgi:hypothetical protein
MVPLYQPYVKTSSAVPGGTFHLSPLFPALASLRAGLLSVAASALCVSAALWTTRVRLQQKNRNVLLKSWPRDQRVDSGE